MAGKLVHLGQVLTGHIVNGIGQRVLAVKAGGGIVLVGTVVHAVIGHINVAVADQSAASAAVHQHAVGIQLVDVQIISVQKRGLFRGIHVGHMNVAVQLRIALQQAGDGIVLVAAQGQQVQVHIRIQTGGDAPGLVGQGIQGLRRQVDLSRRLGKGLHCQIGQHCNGDDHCRGESGIAARLEAAAKHPAELGRFLSGICGLHSLHLLFSSACTDRNRNTPVTDRSYTTAVRSNTPSTKLSKRSNTLS